MIKIVRCALLAVVAVSVAKDVAAQAQAPARCTQPPAPPPAGLDPMSSDPAVRSQLLAYAGTLTFELPGHPTGVQRRLTRRTVVNGQPRFSLGPMAGVAPERCAYRNSRADLGVPGQGGQRTGGRIIARIFLETDSTYSKLGLDQAGAEYFVWVDSLDTKHGAGYARGVLIPNNADPTAAPAQARRVIFQNNPPGLGSRSFAEATWEFRPEDDFAWVSCELTGCCTVGDDPW